MYTYKISISEILNRILTNISIQHLYSGFICFNILGPFYGEAYYISNYDFAFRCLKM